MTEQTPDEFSRLTAGLEAEMAGRVVYNELSRGYEIPLRDDIKRLRSAYHDHMKALLVLEPGAEIRPDEYEFIEAMMNTRDLRTLEELSSGDYIATASPAVVIYYDEPTDAMSFVTTTGEERIGGQFEIVTIVPTPSASMVATHVPDGETPFEPALIITNPKIDHGDGDFDPLGIPAVIVPFLDPEVSFVKLLYGESV